MALRTALGSIERALRRGPSVSAGGLVLTPVVVEERGAGVTGRGCWIVASTRPVAVIVAGPNGRRLVRLEDGAKGRGR
ncbi:MAG: hypothetical protein AAF495_12770 [Pseudomonadota bacterium]